ncbi:hypothetical protein AB0H12_42095 [Actinosynnema sp. NPDC023794]
MVSLSFDLPAPSSPWRRTWQAAGRGDPSAIPEIDLRYKYFGVNVELVAGGVQIISKKGFVTLVDLALSLCGVAERLSRGENASFGFTEREEVIGFHLDGETVTVTSSKDPQSAVAARAELLAELGTFVRTAHARLVDEIPALSDNPVIDRLARHSTC